MNDPARDMDALQGRIASWVRRAFGDEIAVSRWERAMRVLEESLELAQASGVDREEAAAVIDRVYSRPLGEIRQEAAGVAITALALAAAHGFSLADVTGAELERIDDPAVIARIREKHAGKAERGIGLELGPAGPESRSPEGEAG